MSAAPTSIGRNASAISFSKYRMVDGRTYGSILFGELGRLIKTTAVQLAALKLIKSYVADAEHGTPIKELITAKMLAKFLADVEQDEI